MGKACRREAFTLWEVGHTSTLTYGCPQRAERDCKDSERTLHPPARVVHGRQRVAQGLAPDSHFTATKALATRSVVPFKIKQLHAPHLHLPHLHAPHLHLPAAIGGSHLTGKHSAGTTDGAAAGMGSAAGATKEHGAAATLQARFRGRRSLIKLQGSNAANAADAAGAPAEAAGAAGASDVPKEKHGVAATLRVPHLHLHLPGALGGRRPASKHPVGASEGDSKAATTLL